MSTFCVLQSNPPNLYCRIWRNTSWTAAQSKKYVQARLLALGPGCIARFFQSFFSKPLMWFVNFTCRSSGIRLKCRQHFLRFHYEKGTKLYCLKKKMSYRFIPSHAGFDCRKMKKKTLSKSLSFLRFPRTRCPMKTHSIFPTLNLEIRLMASRSFCSGSHRGKKPAGKVRTTGAEGMLP